MPVVEAYGMTEARTRWRATRCRRATGGRARSACRQAPRSRSSTRTGGRSPPAPPARWSVRGPGVIDGYLDNPEANAASFRDGWFRTGDLGRLSRRRLSHARRPAQGADQPRRREDRPARGRRGAARAPGGPRGGRLRRPGREVGRGRARGRRRRRRAVGGRAARLLLRRGWRRSRCRGAIHVVDATSRRVRPARSSAARSPTRWTHEGRGRRAPGRSAPTSAPVWRAEARRPTSSPAARTWRRCGPDGVRVISPAE